MIEIGPKMTNKKFKILTLEHYVGAGKCLTCTKKLVMYLAKGQN